MKIRLFNQSAQFPKHLEILRKNAIMPYDKELLTEKNSLIEIRGFSRLSELNTEAFFNYHIFPEHILNGYPQWLDEQRAIQPGDTIVQQAFLPPLPVLSQKIIFGVRIKEVFREEKRIGFSYETLKGHVEQGISYFTLEETTKGIVFRIRTFSRPGSFLSRIAGPLFSLPYQQYCTRKALQHVKANLLSKNNEHR